MPKLESKFIMPLADLAYRGAMSIGTDQIGGALARRVSPHRQR
ncbi:MAG TPA: hypothetical protein VII70_04110 [Steroidobacteraceae bacterium]